MKLLVRNITLMVPLLNLVSPLNYIKCAVSCISRELPDLIWNEVSSVGKLQPSFGSIAYRILILIHVHSLSLVVGPLGVYQVDDNSFP